MNRSPGPRLPAHAEATIRTFLQSEVGRSAGVVLGLSGGVDSALCARLARDALGPERVLAVVMPAPGPSEALVEEARAFAASIGIDARVVPVGGLVDALRTALPAITEAEDLGNATARARMMVLYALARSAGRRVLGTGNKSEILLGYFTKFGDGGADLMPIGDLYKTEVWELAERLEIPERIRTRVPSAGFWEGQTDEAELGMAYRDLDRILLGLEELRSEAEIAERTGLPLPAVEAVAHRVASNRHKRRLPVIPKLRARTVGIDWRD